jgi:hypothetical protein
MGFFPTPLLRSAAKEENANPASFSFESETAHPALECAVSCIALERVIAP